MKSSSQTLKNRSSFSNSEIKFNFENFTFGKNDEVVQKDYKFCDIYYCNCLVGVISAKSDKPVKNDTPVKRAIGFACKWELFPCIILNLL